MRSAVVKTCLWLFFPPAQGSCGCLKKVKRNDVETSTMKDKPQGLMPDVYSHPQVGLLTYTTHRRWHQGGQGSFPARGLKYEMGEEDGFSFLPSVGTEGPMSKPHPSTSQPRRGHLGDMFCSNY
uniref:Uncharacterized protein n=1 Tax=Myotis myotis TaxID=51298 RepID=A0A7J7Z6S3_MYOMY|nr:hypothetical protein mMyoMyo1_010740 [Myotis myotis]